uniref:Uncharacterized protein n=1 Tax=Kalanchoe fedtschenkoi TaxID=63787 RepID=A0A7N0UPZ6_KALFE
MTNDTRVKVNPNLLFQLGFVFVQKSEMIDDDSNVHAFGDDRGGDDKPQEECGVVRSIPCSESGERRMTNQCLRPSHADDMSPEQFGRRQGGSVV